MVSRWAAAALLVASALVNAKATAQPPTACDPDGPKIDCGAVGTDEAACVAAGCCWQALEAGSADPWCFAANGGDSEYVVAGGGGGDGAVSGGTTTSLTVGAPSSVFAATLVQTAATLAILGEDVTHLAATADASCGDVFRLRLTPAGEPAAYAVPPSLFAGGLDPSPCPPGRPAYAAYVKHAPFGLHVAAADDPGDAGAPLLDTTGRRLIVKRRYVEWTTGLHPQSTLYGLGERTGGLVVDRGTDGRPPPRPRTVWARDRPASAPGENLYGAWPTWMEILPSGSARGGLVVSGTALDVVARPGSLSFRATGGAIDVFVFAGPTPAAVLDQLTRVVGRPALPPAWALGVHQSRWGYRDIDALTAVVEGYDAAGLPLDVVWSDIDAMRGRRDFTISPSRYPADAVRALVARLHAAGRRWVPIVDPGIKVEAGYGPYDDGMAAGVFVRKPVRRGHDDGMAAGVFVRKPVRRGADAATASPPFTGRVWPGAVHYPDFVAAGNATADWWDFHALVPFDGLWIDMNEPSNFNDGVGGCGGAAAAALRREGGSVEAALRVPPDAAAPLHTPSLPCPTADGPPPPSFLPYTPNNGGARLPLASHTLPPDAVGVDGALHVDTHNLYGHAEAAATHSALKGLNGTVRPFVLTRSSFVGTGAYAAHWTGDNAAKWVDLGWAVSGVLAAGLVGIPLAGADVCGFSGDTTPELCARWVGVAALQPFFRDHSDLNAAPQELYRWPETVAAARAALGLRYRLLPALYSAMARAAETGSPAARPLWFEWPGAADARADRHQWMVGDGLMAAPAVRPGVETVQAWLPPGSAWVDVRALDGRVLRGAPRTGTNVTLDAPLTGAPPVLLRCGRAVPMADARRTAEETVVAAAVGVAVCLDDGGAAVGELWTDDGVSALEGTGTAAAWWDFRADERGLNMTVRGGGRLQAGGHWPRLAKVVVVGGGGMHADRARVHVCGREVEAALVERRGVMEVSIGGEGGVAAVCADGRGGVAVEWGVAGRVE